MKKIFILMFLSASVGAFAQGTYLNNQMLCTNDLLGTSRYVSMGGALGALGADISAISDNPAAIGMMRRRIDFSGTLGPAWRSDGSASKFEPTAHCSFDQMGFVTSLKGARGDDDDSGFSTLNFAFNYQKKIDYNQAFLTGVNSSASLASQLAWMTNNYPGGASQLSTSSLYGAAYYGGVMDRADDGTYITPSYPSTANTTLKYSWGSLNSYDFNLSANFSNKYFFGVTVGLDQVNFHQYSLYSEERGSDASQPQDFQINTEERVTGLGVNVKLGFIMRPIEDDPFRFGLTIETPSWMNLSYYTPDQTVYGHTDYDGNYSATSYYPTYAETDNSLDYRVTTPWKFRGSLGTTIGNVLALGLEYEYAGYNWTSMGYPEVTGNYDWFGNYYERTTVYKDQDMNNFTRTVMKGQNTVKFGMEVKPISEFAFRLGYNYVSSPYEKTAYWDPTVADVSWKYPTDLSWINYGDTHIVTAGLGLRLKHFYCDLAYKCRIQNAEYCSFNDGYSDGSVNPSSSINLNRHEITATLGVKF